MKLLTGFLEWNIVTQLLLIFLFFTFKNQFNFVYTLYEFSTGYFIFLILGLLAIISVVWTGFSSSFGLSGVGKKSGRAAKSRGYK